MRYITAIALVLVMAGSAMAETDLVKAFIFLALVTPFGWGAAFIIIYLLVKALISGTKKIATADHSELSAPEKEVTLKQSMREAYLYARSVK
jgi:hypothetical protein